MPQNMLNILPLCQTMMTMPGFGAIPKTATSPAQEGNEEGQEGAGRRKETAHYTERTAEAT